MDGNGMTATDLYLEAMRRSDAHDVDAFVALQAPDAAWTVPGARFEGREAIAGWIGGFGRAFPTYRHEIGTVLEEGGTVFAEGTWTGTHDGPLATPAGDVPPSGRGVTFRWAMVAEFDVAAQQCRRARIYFDQLEFLGQLGLLPESAAA
jgi:ketosteroid isomerase-like protein